MKIKYLDIGRMLYLSALAGALTFRRGFAEGGSNKAPGGTDSAAASVKRASKLGLLRPASIREMYVRKRPALSAKSSCVNPSVARSSFKRSPSAARGGRLFTQAWCASTLIRTTHEFVHFSVSNTHSYQPSEKIKMNTNQSKQKQLSNLFVAVAVAAALAACGGGGSSSSTPAPAAPPAPAPAPAAAAVVSTPSLTFTSVVGSASAAQQVTLTNSGNAALALASITIDSIAFKIAGGTCTAGASIAQGSSCTVDISFGSAIAGPTSATLAFSHNANPSPTLVALSGSAAAIALLPPGIFPAVSAADCPRLLSQAQAVASLSINGADMQLISDILKATSPNHGYQLFARMPGTLMWWLRSQGSIDMGTVGAAVHETNHAFDNAIRQVCNSDQKARLLLDSVVSATDVVNGNGSTANYSIAGETIPVSLKASRRYEIYITGAAEANGNDSAVMLDELNAYTGGAEFELGLLSNSSYAALKNSGDFNAGGQVDFMLYTLAYLQAARLNHPITYSNIVSQTNTIKYIQTVWSRAEANLVALYPHTALAGTGGMVVSKETLAAAYSSSFIGELDRLGVTHKSAADWAGTYLH